MTIAKIKNFINILNFPLQLCLLSIPYMTQHTFIKYLPIITWTGVFISFNLKETFSRIRKQPYLILFLFSMLISAIFNSWIDASKASLLFLGASLLFTTKVPTQRQIIFILLVIFTVICFPSFNHQGFFTSFFLHHNTLGLVIILALHLVTVLSMNLRTKVLVFLILLIPLFLTKSRSAFVFIAFYTTLLFVLNSKLRIKKFIAIATFSITTLGYFLILENAKYLNKFLEKGPSIHQGKTAFNLSGRDKLYEASKSIIKEHPIGVGSKSSKPIFREVARVDTPHNVYLKIAVDYGVISLAIYTLLFLSILKTNSNPYFLSFFLAYHVKMLFESGIPFGFSLASALLIYPPFFLLQPNEKVGNSVS